MDPSFDLGGKKTPAKQGRRAAGVAAGGSGEKPGANGSSKRQAKLTAELDSDEEQSNIATTTTASSNNGNQNPSTPTKKTGGSGGGGKRQSGWENAPDRGGDISGGESGSEPDIPTLPDDDANQTADFDAQGQSGLGEVTLAPSMTTSRMATHRELEADLEHHYPFMTLADIDLKLLGKYLAAEAEVQEDGEAWDWDTLYTNVSSELMKEIENMDSLNLSDFGIGPDKTSNTASATLLTDFSSRKSAEGTRKTEVLSSK